MDLQYQPRLHKLAGTEVYSDVTDHLVGFTNFYQLFPLVTNRQIGSHMSKCMHG
jgi:hypothetical protein